MSNFQKTFLTSLRAVSVIIGFSCLLILGCQGQNPPGDNPALQTGFTITGFIALSQAETANLASIKRDIKAGNELDFSSFIAVLKNSIGEEIARSNVASRSFIFREVTPTNNLRIEIVSSDVSNRKLRLLHFFDTFSNDVTIQIDEESTALGLIIEKAKEQNKEVTVSTVIASYAPQLENLKNAFTEAVKKAVSGGSSVEEDTTLITKLTETVTEIPAQTTTTTTPTPMATTTTPIATTTAPIATSTASDITPPAISNINVPKIDQTAATIVWTTDEESTSLVEYGTTTSYGSSTTIDLKLTKSHSVSISGLIASTSYHFRVKSKDAGGNEGLSSDATFSTSPVPDTTPPQISEVNAGNIATDNAAISWTTDEPATSQVDYGVSENLGTLSSLKTTLEKSHSVSLSSLAEGTKYYFKVISNDGSNNKSESGISSFTTDYTPLVVSDVYAGSVSYSGVTIGWKTNKEATSQVEYGVAAYTSSAPASLEVSEKTTSHSITITNLSAGTNYHFRVVSIDPISGEPVYSEDKTFTTSLNPMVTLSQKVSNTTSLELQIWLTGISTGFDTSTEVYKLGDPTTKISLTKDTVNSTGEKLILSFSGQTVYDVEAFDSLTFTTPLQLGTKIEVIDTQKGIQVVATATVQP